MSFIILFLVSKIVLNQIGASKRIFDILSFNLFEISDKPPKDTKKHRTYTWTFETHPPCPVFNPHGSIGVVGLIVFFYYFHGPVFQQVYGYPLPCHAFQNEQSIMLLLAHFVGWGRGTRTTLPQSCNGRTKVRKPRYSHGTSSGRLIQLVAQACKQFAT